MKRRNDQLEFKRLNKTKASDTNLKKSFGMYGVTDIYC